MIQVLTAIKEVSAILPVAHLLLLDLLAPQVVHLHTQAIHKPHLKRVKITKILLNKNNN